MAVCVGVDSIPVVGDKVSKIVVSDFDNVLETHFESGKILTSHIWHQDLGEIRKAFGVTPKKGTPEPTGLKS